ncbi:hypothetical protein OS493_010263 [Desmophyllum pertusum]|uniref:EGF-like domain-containing protein n=1 Tax=Desmophyllum pertusum TaxID=174260 RepID=A0A9X0A3B5_9CNID|nr:hypothetical protein OS493_010263 [Desmophyllum pertusum]
MNNCSNHGNCTGPNECTCEKGFQARADCSKACGQSEELEPRLPDHSTTPPLHNSYVSLHDTVTCEALNNCSNHGSCTGPNECTCEKGFQAGADCSKVSCESLNHCSNHGNCSGPNVCSCHSGFKGLSCSEACGQSEGLEPRLPDHSTTPPLYNSYVSLHDTVTCEALNNCSNHGSCTGPNECTCEKGFQGTNCSEVISEEQGGSWRLSRAALVGVSIGACVLFFVLCQLVIYRCKKRKTRRRSIGTIPQRKG